MQRIRIKNTGEVKDTVDCKFHIQFQYVLEKWIGWTLTGVHI